MIRYEYRIFSTDLLSMDPKAFVGHLNRLGDEGWEVATFMTSTKGSSVVVHLMSAELRQTEGWLLLKRVKTSNRKE